MIPKIEVDVVVIGAGVVGLAVAHELSQKCQVALLEKNSRFGEETSSRNSEVIHSGIYYEPNSKKSDLCLQGNELLYEFCSRYSIPFINCGKFIVATDEAQKEKLDALKGRAKILGVKCEEVSSEKIRTKEPLVKAVAGLFLPQSGVLDSHLLMATLEKLASTQGALLGYRHQPLKFSRFPSGWHLTYLNQDQVSGEIQTQYVVNCAGLGAAELSNLAHQNKKYQHRYCRGKYLSLSTKFKNAFSSLVYPLPGEDGLGVHVTRDLSGMVRLGPDVEWSNVETYERVYELYQCDWESVFPGFLAAVTPYFPSLSLKDLSPGTIGVRPKLFVEGNAYRDFLIEKSEGWVDVLGIESPGLTASLAIAKAVGQLISVI